MSSSEQPVWFITGCSTGFGRELAKLVLQRGERAVVTARKPDHVTDIVEGYEDQALVQQLDVTDSSQVAEAVKQAKSRFGRIDVLVNNAGYGYLAAVEEGEDTAIRELFDANVFGLAELTRAVLPGMRERRSGHVLNVSSIGGLVGFGATGYYHATKFAVEGLSESLAVEGAPLGISVTIVEPGPFRTNWAGPSIKQSQTVVDDYADTAGERRKQTVEGSGAQAGDPARAAEAMMAVVRSESPPMRLLLGERAVVAAQGKIAALQRDLDGWREVSLGADFPASE